MRIKQFPKIYRFITERPLLSVLLLSSFLLLFILIGLDSVKNFHQLVLLENQRKEINSSVAYWQGIVGKYKDYRDGYFQLAVLEYRLRNLGKSKEYLEKVLKIDPNFEKGKELENLLKVK